MPLNPLGDVTASASESAITARLSRSLPSPRMNGYVRPTGISHHTDQRVVTMLPEQGAVLDWIDSQSVEITGGNRFVRRAKGMATTVSIFSINGPNGDLFQATTPEMTRYTESRTLRSA